METPTRTETTRNQPGLYPSAATPPFPTPGRLAKPQGHARGKASPRADLRASRLINSLELPDRAAEVLGHQRYWTADFCRLYFEVCDEALFTDPYRAFPMAQIAPRLVNLLPEGGAKSDLMVHALAVLGSANRAVGALGDADGCYRTAFAICQRTAIAPIEHADLQRRYSNLLLEQGRSGLALETIETAIDTLTAIAPHGEGDYCLGAALVQRGVVRIHREEIAEALEDFGLALVALDPKYNPRAYYSALHNLAYALPQTGNLAHLYQASRHLRTAKKLLEGRRNCLARYKLYWIEATLLQRLGSTRRAESSLQIARKGFARIGARIEWVLSSIELAVIYELHDESKALTELAYETLAFCRSSKAPREALRILGEWQEAAEEGTATIARMRSWGREYESMERAARYPSEGSKGSSAEPI